MTVARHFTRKRWGMFFLYISFFCQRLIFKTSAYAWLYCGSALFCQVITSIIEERKL